MLFLQKEMVLGCGLIHFHFDNCGLPRKELAFDCTKDDFRTQMGFCFVDSNRSFVKEMSRTQSNKQPFSIEFFNYPLG